MRDRPMGGVVRKGKCGSKFRRDVGAERKR